MANSIHNLITLAVLAFASVASAAETLESVAREATAIAPAASNNNAESIATPAEEMSGLTLALVEELAVTNHPTIAQAQARIRALNGKWVQVGLAPNPTIGYLGSEIGAGNTAGQQGGFAGQQFVTAHKLKKNRAIVCAEISKAEQQLAAVIRRVQTDVRLSFYNALLAQQRVVLATDLVQIAEAAVETSQSLVDAAEIPLAGLLQSEVQLQNALVLKRTSENGLDQAWRQLQTIAGGQVLSRQSLVGEVSQLPTSLNFDEQLQYVQQTSPELAAAMADVVRSRHVLNRECVEAVPNVNTQFSVQYDNEGQDTIAGVQIGIALPLWNRNQGAICRARAEVTQAARNVDRVERSLQRRLVDAFREYSDARVTVETYSSEILTRSQRTLDLIRQGYSQGEVGYLDLLTAQRTFSETNLSYLNALGSLWQSYLKIDGLLLDGSLETEIQ